MVYLVKDDLFPITGAQRKGKQARVLKEMGIPFISRPDGWPVVNSDDIKTRARSNNSEPNWAALD